MMSNQYHPSAEEILERAAATLRTRAEERDSPDGSRSMQLAIDTYNELTGSRLSESDGWLFMLLLKLARSRQGGYQADDYLDAVGYAALLAECAANEKA